jgi:hypothetical protein
MNGPSPSPWSASRRVEADKGLEYAVQIVCRNALAGVVNLDTKWSPPVACIQQGRARRPACDLARFAPSLVRCHRAAPADSVSQREWARGENRSNYAAPARLAVAQDAAECIRAEPVPARSDCHAVGAGAHRPTGPAFPQVGPPLLTAFEMLALGSGSDPPGEQFVRADDRLQRLAQIVTRNHENGDGEIGGPEKILYLRFVASVRRAVTVGVAAVCHGPAYLDRVDAAPSALSRREAVSEQPTR